MIEITIPQENANDSTVLITKVLASNGQHMKIGDPMFEFETSKAAVEFSSPSDGYLESFDIKEGDKVAVDCVVGVLVEKLSEPKKVNKKSAKSKIDDKKSGVSANFGSHVSDEAKALLDQGVKPVGSSEWLTTSDFTKPLFEKSRRGKDTYRADHETKGLDNVKIPFRVEDQSQRKALEINALKVTSPHLNSTLGTDIVFTIPRAGTLFLQDSILDLVVYETALLLRSEFCDLNVAYAGDNKKVIFETVIPGIAFDEKNNLTVIALEFETLEDLNKNIIDAALRFYENSLKISDIADTTFTVTDLSRTNINFVQPLINSFQAFILGICSSKTGFQIFGTFDHRVTDGKRFATFLDELKRRVQLHNEYSTNFVTQICCKFCLKSIHEDKKLGGRGLLKIHDGVEEKFICQTCFEGW